MRVDLHTDDETLGVEVHAGFVPRPGDVICLSGQIDGVYELKVEEVSWDLEKNGNLSLLCIHAQKKEERDACPFTEGQ